jgi:predicted ester cyclase
MDCDANKKIVRRIYEQGFNEGDASVFDELYAADFRHHNKTIHDVSSGGAGERESMLRFRDAIPDVHFSIDHSIAEADKVVVLLTVTGTPVKEFPPIKPGEAMEFHAAAIFRIEGGKVAEEWFYREPTG